MDAYDGYMDKLASPAGDALGRAQEVLGWLSRQAKEHGPRMAKGVGDALGHVGSVIKEKGPGIVDKGLGALHSTAAGLGSAAALGAMAGHYLPKLHGAIEDSLVAGRRALGLQKKLPGWVKPVAIGAGGVALGGMAANALSGDRQ